MLLSLGPLCHPPTTPSQDLPPIAETGKVLTSPHPAQLSHLLLGRSRLCLPRNVINWYPLHHRIIRFSILNRGKNCSWEKPYSFSPQRSSCCSWCPPGSKVTSWNSLPLPIAQAGYPTRLQIHTEIHASVGSLPSATTPVQTPTVAIVTIQGTGGIAALFSSSFLIHGPEEQTLPPLPVSPYRRNCSPPKRLRCS